MLADKSRRRWYARDDLAGAPFVPLLADPPVTGRSAAWAFIPIWRVADGMLVEHWACRDDMGLLEQLRPS